jgi:hypothetical protein
LVLLVKAGAAIAQPSGHRVSWPTAMQVDGMFEKAWYELSPYVYAVVALFVLYYANVLGGVFAIVLLCVSGLIMFLRYKSRSLARKTTKRPKSRPKRQF